MNGLHLHTKMASILLQARRAREARVCLAGVAPRGRGGEQCRRAKVVARRRRAAEDMINIR